MPNGSRHGAARRGRFPHDKSDHLASIRALASFMPTNDCLELLRPMITDAVMQWITAKTFARAAGLVIKAVPLANYIETVRAVERMF